MWHLTFSKIITLSNKSFWSSILVENDINNVKNLTLQIKPGGKVNQIKVEKELFIMNEFTVMKMIRSKINAFWQLALFPIGKKL